MQKWIIITIVSFIILLGVIIFLNINIETEYIPEGEIEEADLRKTIISLYFKNHETGNLDKENKLVDSKELLIDPYQFLIRNLIDGPEKNTLDRLIPENTKILETKFDSGCVIINFSNEFIDENLNNENMNLAIESIFKTLSELTEVNSIKILINDNEVENISSVITKDIIENKNV